MIDKLTPEEIVEFREGKKDIAERVKSNFHTCSYECDRPECIKAQRDELMHKTAKTIAKIAAQVEANTTEIRRYHRACEMALEALVGVAQWVEQRPATHPWDAWQRVYPAIEALREVLGEKNEQTT